LEINFNNLSYHYGVVLTYRINMTYQHIYIIQQLTFNSFIPYKLNSRPVCFNITLVGYLMIFI